jgi:hypothetical protein
MMTWRLWEKSAGPLTVERKARVSGNANRGGYPRRPPKLPEVRL